MSWAKRLRAWLLEPVTTRLDELLSRFPNDPRADPEHVRCPVCGKTYNMSVLVPKRVSHVTVECNRCYEHMELTRKGDGWHVEFRDKAKV